MRERTPFRIVLLRLLLAAARELPAFLLDFIDVCQLLTSWYVSHVCGICIKIHLLDSNNTV